MSADRKQLENNPSESDQAESKASVKRSTRSSQSRLPSETQSDIQEPGTRPSESRPREQSKSPSETNPESRTSSAKAPLTSQRKPPPNAFLKMLLGDPTVELPEKRKSKEPKSKKPKSRKLSSSKQEEQKEEPVPVLVRPAKGKAYFTKALQGNRYCMHAMLPFRCLFAFMAAISFAIIYGLKVNLSILIVAMVNYTALQKSLRSTSQCPKPEIADDLQDGPFVWTPVQQGYALSAYFYGYLVAQIPGAILAHRYSAKWVMFVGIAINIVATALTPVFAFQMGLASVIVLRVLQGLGGGVTFPAMHVMLSKWAPAASRSIFSGVVYSGISIGMVGSVLLGGYVAKYIDWEWVFYLMALLSLPWCVFWVCWITDTPPDFQGKDEAPPKFPIKEAFKSIPFWAIIVAHFCGNSGLYMVITEAPSFLKEVLHMTMKQNAEFSAIPYVFMYVVSVAVGTALDYLRRDKITTTVARKIAAVIAMVIPASCLVGMTFIGCSVTTGLVILTIAVAAIGAQTSCYLSNHIDLSPNHAGMLMGISNTIATIPGMTIPPLIGVLTSDSHTLEKWSIAFYSIAALYYCGFIVYFICASGARQPWDARPEEAGPARPSR